MVKPQESTNLWQVVKEAKSASDGLSAFTVRRVERLEARYGEEQVDKSVVLTLRPLSRRGSVKPELINGITLLLGLARVNKIRAHDARLRPSGPVWRSSFKV